MNETIETKKKTTLNRIQHFVDRGGPREWEYPELTENIDRLAGLIKDQTLPAAEIDAMLSACGFVQNQRSVMGHIRLKPYGYAGDFDIIDRIYRQETCDPEYSYWDRFALQHSAAAAVRNRKRYFVEMITARMGQGHRLELCNIASGPGRDLYEAYELLTDKSALKTTCVEMEPKAIGYASKLNEAYAEHIHFVQRNVFRFQSEKQYDLVWSAGLFDYFDDKLFVLLLNRFGQWLKPGGEIVIGNFNEAHNPSRDFMEIFGDWHLNHRSEEQLISLALEAGYSREQLYVGREPEQVNLFLHIRMS